MKVLTCIKKYPRTVTNLTETFSSILCDLYLSLYHLIFVGEIGHNFLSHNLLQTGNQESSTRDFSSSYVKIAFCAFRIKDQNYAEDELGVPSEIPRLDFQTNLSLKYFFL